MIEIRDYGFNYNVLFKKPKKKYSDFFVAITKIPETAKLANIPG